MTHTVGLFRGGFAISKPLINSNQLAKNVVEADTKYGVGKSKYELKI